MADVLVVKVPLHGLDNVHEVLQDLMPLVVEEGSN